MQLANRSRRSGSAFNRSSSFLQRADGSVLGSTLWMPSWCTATSSILTTLLCTFAVDSFSHPTKTMLCSNEWGRCRWNTLWMCFWPSISSSSVLRPTNWMSIGRNRSLRSLPIMQPEHCYLISHQQYRRCSWTKINSGSTLNSLGSSMFDRCTDGCRMW
jgi:hypothetical protein